MYYPITFIIIFLACGFVLSFLFGYVRNSPPNEKVVGIFSTNGVNIGFLCALLISGVFGWRGLLQEDTRYDILPETNFDFNPKAAFKGAVFYGIGFAVFMVFVVIMVFQFGSDLTQNWMLEAAHLYISPYSSKVGIKNAATNSILLGITVGILFGGAFGFLLRGQKGKVVNPGVKPLRANHQNELIKLIKGLLVSPSFIYSLSCISLFFIVITILHSELSLKEILLNSVLFGMTFAIVLIIWQKGFDLIQAMTIRIILYNQGLLPKGNFREFLEYGTKLSFLKKIGNEYSFYHNEIRDHLSKRESDKNLGNSLGNHWNQFINKLLVISGFITVSITAYQLFNSQIENYFFPTNDQLRDYERYTLRVGDNIDGSSGVLLDQLDVKFGDTMVIHSWVCVHPGDFITWAPPEGTSIGLFGFPLFGAYDIENLAQDTPLLGLLWRISDEQMWHLYNKGEKIAINRSGRISFNLNGRHYQKFKGKFYVSVYINRKL